MEVLSEFNDLFLFGLELVEDGRLTLLGHSLPTALKLLGEDLGSLLLDGFDLLMDFLLALLVNLFIGFLLLLGLFGEFRDFGVFSDLAGVEVILLEFLPLPTGFIAELALALALALAFRALPPGPLFLFALLLFLVFVLSLCLGLFVFVGLLHILLLLLFLFLGGGALVLWLEWGACAISHLW